MNVDKVAKKIEDACSRVDAMFDGVDEDVYCRSDTCRFGVPASACRAPRECICTTESAAKALRWHAEMGAAWREALVGLAILADPAMDSGPFVITHGVRQAVEKLRTKAKACLHCGAKHRDEHNHCGACRAKISASLVGKPLAMARFPAALLDPKPLPEPADLSKLKRIGSTEFVVQPLSNEPWEFRSNPKAWDDAVAAFARTVKPGEIRPLLPKAHPHDGERCCKRHAPSIAMMQDGWSALPEDCGR